MIQGDNPLSLEGITYKETTNSTFIKHCWQRVNNNGFKIELTV